VLVVIVEASIAWLKVAVTVVVVATPVAPLVGVDEVTVGGGAAVAVVNDQVKSLARAVPLVSFTPVAPPFTVAV
jgi:hypothetical protein